MFRSSLLILIILAIAFIFGPSAGQAKKPPSAVVTGTVYCDTCFLDGFSRNDNYVSGATVAVECWDGKSRRRFRKEARTNKQGEFMVKLPPSISKHLERIEGCDVKLLTGGDANCAVASSTASSSSIKLKSSNQETHIFSAGSFTFKPLKQPEACSQKQTITKTRELDSSKTLVTSTEAQVWPVPQTGDQDTLPLPTFPELPRLPELPPLPALPALPALPGLPKPPQVLVQGDVKLGKMRLPRRGNDEKPSNPEFFPPAFQSPPPAFTAPLPPNPVQPLAPVPPLPFKPLSPPAFGLPSISDFSGLNPPPPPSPALRFPINPFHPLIPFHPKAPGFPVFPPASSAGSTAKQTSP